MSIRVNGVSLQTFAWGVTKRGARWRTPEVRGDNVQVAGRHGSLWTAGKRYDENVLTLQMWAVGAQPDGTIPPGKRQQVRGNIDELLRLFTGRTGLLRVEEDQPDGQVRQCMGEVTQALEFTSQAGATRASFGVELIIPGGFWRDTADTTWTSAAGLTDGQMVTPTPFGASNAPLVDGMFVVHGPADGPEIMVAETGGYVRLQGILAVGEDWRVDSGGWSARRGTGIGFGGTGVDATGDTVYGGAPRMVEVTPGSGLRFGGQNTGAETQLEMRGRNAYLLA